MPQVDSYSYLVNTLNCYLITESLLSCIVAKPQIYIHHNTKVRFPTTINFHIECMWPLVKDIVASFVYHNASWRISHSHWLRLLG